MATKPKKPKVKAKINSRQKGAAAERELANILKARGHEAKRGQQFHGGADSPDVVGLPGWHIENKRVEAGNPYVWMAQAIHDAGGKNKPVVTHRRNGKEYLAILRLEDFLDLVETVAWSAALGITS